VRLIADCPRREVRTARADDARTRHLGISPNDPHHDRAAGFIPEMRADAERFGTSGPFSRLA
jgi:hypothetical protein